MSSITNKRANTSQRKGVFAALLALALLCGGSGMQAQQEQPPESPPPPPVLNEAVLPPQTGGPEELHLLVGRSLVISSPVRLKRVSLADPRIADALLVSPNQLLINGKVAGAVSLVLWDEFDQSQTFDLFVDLDILDVSRKIGEVFPDEPVRIEASKDMVLLSGRISSEAIADKILEVVSATTPKVISLMEVEAPPTKGEILLEVRFAEVNRAALSQYGVNLFSTGALNTSGSTTTQQFGNFEGVDIKDRFGVRADPFPNIPVPTTGPATETFGIERTINDLLNIFIFRPDIHLGAVIRALKQKNLLQILAEPNLLTQTGKEASFLAGGEFPFPVVQGGTSSNAVTIQFKEFGVRLSFTPTLTVDGKIHLKVKPEVSALDFANALTISGFFIPALSTRRVETEMELADGQSFAIAGLVDNRLVETISKIPILGDIPVLGKLFRSRSLNKSKTELLVLVTPRIVKPLLPGEWPAGPQYPKPFLPPAAPEDSKPAAQQ